jgi:hypothetical protein
MVSIRFMVLTSYKIYTAAVPGKSMGLICHYEIGRGGWRGRV